MDFYDAPDSEITAEEWVLRADIWPMGSISYGRKLGSFHCLRTKLWLSRTLMVFLLATHRCGLVGHQRTSIELDWRIGLAILVLANPVNTIRNTSLVLDSLGRTGGNSGSRTEPWPWPWYPVSRSRSSCCRPPYVTPGLLVLNLRCGRWRLYAMVLLPDTLDKSDTDASAW